MTVADLSVFIIKNLKYKKRIVVSIEQYLWYTPTLRVCKQIVFAKNETRLNVRQSDKEITQRCFHFNKYLAITLTVFPDTRSQNDSSLNIIYNRSLGILSGKQFKQQNSAT